MSIVDVLEVRLHPVSRRLVREFVLAAPAAGASGETYALTVEGRVAPGVAAPERIEMIGAGRGPVWPMDFNLSDARAGRGFRHSVSVTRLPPDFKAHLILELANGDRLRMATIAGRRKVLPAQRSRYQPLMLTTLGRTGASWTASVLGQHPEIVSFGAFLYEPRAGQYWADIFQALAEPQSYQQYLQAERFDSAWWLGGGNLAPPPDEAHVPQFERWLGREGVERLATVAVGQIDSFYDAASDCEGKPRARHFVEKYLPGSDVQPLFWEIYPDAREVFLIRDFRDMAASQLAYIEQRGHQLFGRSAAASDVEHVHRLRGSARAALRDWRARSARAHLVRYEDLVRQPQETLSALLDYVGVERSAEVIDRMTEGARATRRATQAAHRTTPSAEASIGRWRQLEDRLKQACESAFDEELSGFGYS